MKQCKFNNLTLLLSIQHSLRTTQKHKEFKNNKFRKTVFLEKQINKVIQFEVGFKVSTPLQIMPIKLKKSFKLCRTLQKDANCERPQLISRLLLQQLDNDLDACDTISLGSYSVSFVMSCSQ